MRLLLPLLALLALGCEAQIPLGTHTPQLALGAMTVGVHEGKITNVHGVPVTVNIRRTPKPWGMQLVAKLQTGEGITVDLREGDLVPIAGRSWRVLAIKAFLRESVLLNAQMALVLEQ